MTIGCTVPVGTERIGPPGTLGDSRAREDPPRGQRATTGPRGLPDLGRRHTRRAGTLRRRARRGRGRGAAARRPSVRGLLRGALRRGRGRAARRRVRAARRSAPPRSVRRRRQPAHRAAPLPDRPGEGGGSRPRHRPRRLPAAHGVSPPPGHSHLRLGHGPQRDAAGRPRPRDGADPRVALLGRVAGAAGLRDPIAACPTPGSTSTTPTTPTSFWPAVGCGRRTSPRWSCPRSRSGTPRPASWRNGSASPTRPPPATRSTSWWSAADRRAWPPRSTARPRASTRWRSTRWPPAARPAPARSSRTTWASPTACPAATWPTAPRPRPAASAPGSTPRATSPASRPGPRSTPSSSPTAARSPPGR